jgi:XTP/dITP diphosphohydrolase
MLSNPNQTAQAFLRLLEIMDELREKCPWDRKQTLESLRHLTIEETYELSEAILDQNFHDLKAELGDLMLHIVFYAKIASESGQFNIEDVLKGIAEKLIRRHPHIYSDTQVENEEEVKRNWEVIKLAENQGQKSVLEGVPKSLPALVKAIRIQEKARGVGFDWAEKEQVWLKVKEELSEFEQANDELSASQEFGDLMFSLVNYARFLGINPEEALEKTNRKFIRRFQYIEAQAIQEGKTLTDMSLQEMELHWQAAKSQPEE